MAIGWHFYLAFKYKLLIIIDLHNIISIVELV